MITGVRWSGGSAAIRSGRRAGSSLRPPTHRRAQTCLGFPSSTTELDSARLVELGEAFAERRLLQPVLDTRATFAAAMMVVSNAQIHGICAERIAEMLEPLG